MPEVFSAKVLGTILVSTDLEESENTILEYTVLPGDTLSKIAKKFGITTETIIWANNLKSSLILPGEKLIILPVSGVLHYVKEGETISYLAKLYQVNPEKIISFNNLSEEDKIYIGDLLIIPGAKMPKVKPISPSLPLAKNMFICPISSPCHKTQGLHWYNAIDFSNGRCGEPVFAVAGGKIQKTGWQRVAGRFIRILHPSGIVTFYGHLSKILVKPGQRIWQGKIIGYTGHTGYTIPSGPKGCHLHFEVRGAKNPFL
jgi:murein DD-endopeptidase MepM/ murein hydrolase activator NlpD